MLRFRSALLVFLALPALAWLPGCGDDSPAKEDGTETASGPTPAPGGTNPKAPRAEPAPPPPPPATVLVTVDGFQITQADLNALLERQFGRGKELTDEQLAEKVHRHGKMFLDRMVEDRLVAAKAKAEGLAPTDEEIQAEWDKLKKRLPPAMTVDKLLAQRGMTREQGDADIRKFLSRKKLFEKAVADITVTEEEAKAYYEKHKASFNTPEQVKARHVLLMTQGKSDEEKAAKRKEIDEIRERLVKSNGADFASVAEECSDCPSKAKGGDLGYFGRGAMVPEFDKMAFDLKPGEISPVVETKFGFHVLLVDDKRPAGLKPYDQVSDIVKRQLEGTAKRKAQSDLMAKLKADAKIVAGAKP